jgi:hypothetical protein
MHYFPKNLIESKIYHQKVLLQSFPKNGHVSRFRQSLDVLCPTLGDRSRHQPLKFGMDQSSAIIHN